MKQRQFEARHAALWDEIGQELKARKPSLDLPARYRALCHTLAVARQRGYSPSLVARLDSLAIAAHRTLYRSSANQELVFVRWLRVDFPRLVRAEWRVVLLALVAFLLPALICIGLVNWRPELAYTVIEPGQLADYESMYRKAAERLGRKGPEDDILMFGVYVWNNISIDLRTFAGGLVLGLGALVSTAYNGMHFGVIGTWLAREPATREAFLSFVVTHSSFEVTGLLLACAAGLKLGGALLLPGRMTRMAALRNAGHRILPMLGGAVLLTLFAAFVEAFWSARTDVPALTKYIVGGLTWFIVIAYFCLMGRRRAA
ncbi:stage II sporulation protein M [Chitiniphilus eburneus]|uniref:Stage II sporulation protein M n=1 Tax=Chitiniphilus eburneus TaxID=2571148 RepID=A0A4U0QCQ8_9NEIS|nr:stage II sporulation protein M [Chitiniphilus eburneus]TJZ79096.1 stage II sporulation protein M [Chitiniphilus eburneus]